MSSEWHGGFLLACPSASAFEAVRRVARDYMFREVPEAHAYRIVVTRLPATELVHLALRGPKSEGKDLATFHIRHVALAGLIARALGVRVHAYSFEDQAGSEGVTSFAPDGTQTHATFVAWDDVVSSRAPSFDTDDEEAADEALAAALPLTHLAEALYVTRGTLTEDPREHPSYELKLVGDVPVAALQAYLTS